MLFVRSEKGVAAIMFAIMAPVLFGFLFLAIEGTRYVQDKTRLADASEQAAVAASVLDMPPVGQDQDYKKIAVNVINSFIPELQLNSKSKSISVIRKGWRCRGYQCTKVDESDELHVDHRTYQVNSQLTFTSWLQGGNIIPGFEKNIVIGNQGLSISQVGRGAPTDLMLAIDGSGSMKGFGDQMKESIQKLITTFRAEPDIYSGISLGTTTFNSIAYRFKNGKGKPLQYFDIAHDYNNYHWWDDWRLYRTALIDNLFTYPWKDNARQVSWHKGYQSIPLVGYDPKSAYQKVWDQVDEYNDLDGSTTVANGVISAAQELDKAAKTYAKDKGHHQIIALISDTYDNTNGWAMSSLQDPSCKTDRSNLDNCMCNKIRDTLIKDGSKSSVIYLFYYGKSMSKIQARNCYDKVFHVQGDLSDLAKEIAGSVRSTTLGDIHFRYDKQFVNQ
ncbi:TadE/TadG family type IV pilus assembly protein [Dongshaea marina]|uniref:TadE/TadG family type IV pilus assembly protein n=1 Tax=Dongshaea marina TaxID=2047966 RepID=UPI000D3EA12B|nr:TadE/TadG family type IV pilus assembly protein [Dongshaea marina]